MEKLVNQTFYANDTEGARGADRIVNHVVSAAQGSADAASGVTGDRRSGVTGDRRSPGWSSLRVFSMVRSPRAFPWRTEAPPGLRGGARSLRVTRDGSLTLHGPCREHGSVVLETDAALDTHGKGTRVRPSGVNPQRSPTEPSARPQGAPRQDWPPCQRCLATWRRPSFIRFRGNRARSLPQTAPHVTGGSLASCPSGPGRSVPWFWIQHWHTGGKAPAVFERNV